MKVVTIFLVVIFVPVVLLGDNTCVGGGWPEQRKLSPEEKAKLEELKKNEDLIGIIKLWENIGTEDAQDPVDEDIRNTLFSFPTAKFLTAMLEGMKSEKRFVSRFCLSTLVLFKEKKAIPYLIKEVYSPPLTNEQKKRAFELAAELGSDDFKRREDAQSQLLALGPHIVVIIESFKSHPDPEIQQRVEKIISIIEARAIVTLDKIRALRGFKDQSALPVLRALVQDKDTPFQIVSEAILAMGECGTDEDAAIIRSFLDIKSYQRAYAVMAAANLRDVKAVPMLLNLLRLEDYSSGATTALGKIGDKQAIKPLEDLLAKRRNKPDEVAFISALARLGERKNLREYLAAGKFHRGDVEIIRELELEEFTLLLKQLPAMKDVELLRYILWESQGMIFPKDNDFIDLARRTRKALTESADSELMRVVIYLCMTAMLVNAGDETEEKALIEQTRDKDAMIRARALQVFGATKNPRFYTIPIEFLDDADARWGAIWSIQMISGEPFRVWYFDPDRQVAEIKEWYKKYLEKKAEEKKTPE